MRIAEGLTPTAPGFSLEFYAPYTDDGVPALLDTIGQFARFRPRFVSVTCSTGARRRRRRTLELVRRVKEELAIEAMPHLTCLGTSGEELHAQLQSMAASGIENVLALRGDPPRNEGADSPPAGAFAHASDLAAFIAGQYDLCIAGACYPQGHPESASLQEDLDHLARKVEAGVAFLITQAFFYNDHYFRFVERARAAGIGVPILPGLLPITSLRGLERMATLDARATVPDTLRRALVDRAGDAEAVAALGVAHATRQGEELLRHGAPGVHFYTLNDPVATSAIIAALQQPGPR